MDPRRSTGQQLQADRFSLNVVRHITFSPTTQPHAATYVNLASGQTTICSFHIRYVYDLREPFRAYDCFFTTHDSNCWQFRSNDDGTDRAEAR